LTDAGFNVIGAVEIDPLSAETYAKNFPRVRLWRRDIRRVAAPEIMRRLDLELGELDLLAGCPPCEGFSTVRTLNGSRSPADPRNDLVLQISKFVRALRPKTILVENVPALTCDHRFARFVGVLNRLGYRTRYDIVDAATYGVAQRRRRMILVASILGEPPSNPPPQEPVTVWQAIGRLPPAGWSGDPLHDHGETRSREIRELIARIPSDGGSRRDLPIRDQLSCHLACGGFRDVYGRMSWDAVAPTITGGCVNPSKGRFLHPEEDRAITLREAALLQSFPPDYHFSLSKGKYAAAVMIGNALPPKLVMHQASALRRHLKRCAAGQV
jgi:DNA (cytosine-5)-methyltransferase 1